MDNDKMRKLAREKYPTSEAGLTGKVWVRKTA